MMRSAQGLFIALTLFAAGAPARAASILVINASVSGAVGVVGAITHLTNLGHTVTTGGALADYSAFDQVWDLRYQTSLTAQEVVAFGDYLAGGGRLYLTGEGAGTAAGEQRNGTLVTFLAAVGAGSVAYDTTVPSNTQLFTGAGVVLNTPNVLGSVGFLGARSVADPGSGFLVTEFAPGLGSLVAWDFGDIAGAPTARMIVLWDIDAYRTGVNGIGFVENLAEFLGAPVPEPASPWLLAAGSLVLVALRGKRFTG